MLEFREKIKSYWGKWAGSEMIRHERLISTYPQFSVWREEDKPCSLTVNGRVVAFRHHYERAFWRRVFDLLTLLLKERIVFDRRQM